MKCYHHLDREAVAYCNVCGKALCPECAGRYNVPLCGDCARDEVVRERDRIKRNAVIGGCLAAVVTGCYAAGFIMAGPSTWSAMSIWAILELLSIPIILLCVPFGWGALSRLTANTFLILPIIGWVMYPLIKTFLSLYVGLVAAPMALIRYRRLKADVDLIEAGR